MKLIKKKSASIIAIMLLTVAAIVPFNSLTVNAANTTGKVFNVPLCYYDLSPSEDPKTINVQITLSTPTLQKGTVLTVVGLPSDAANWAPYGELYTVDFSQCSFSDYEYYNEESFGGEDGKSYLNGAVSYTLTSALPVQVTFGGWYGGSEGGLDDSYTISTNGVIAGWGLGTYFDENGNIVNDDPPYSESHLEYFVLNDSEFNALTYYLSNPDLQVTIGANPIDLYNHWITQGKAEGRIAI